MSLVILLASHALAADLPPELEAKYLKRALVVDGAGDDWAVYRNGRPVTARWLAANTHDEPLNTDLKAARRGAFIATGVMGGTAIVAGGTAMACTMLFVASSVGGEWAMERTEPPPWGTCAVAAGATTLLLAGGATAVPLVVIGEQKDVSRFYDEARARELVDAYNTELRAKLTPAASGEVHLWVAGTGLGIAGTF